MDSIDIDQIIKDIPNNDIIIFTYGSVKKNKNDNDPRTGAGITISKHKEIVFEQSYNLGTYPTINQCELFAINQAALWLNITNPPKTKVHTLSDSDFITLLKLSSDYTNELPANKLSVFIFLWHAMLRSR